MKRLMVGLLVLGLVASFCLLSFLSAFAQRDVFVDGHIRQDGTYVAPHWRSAPDGNPNNNWTTTPNVNPYTGERGTRPPRYEPVRPLQPIPTQPANPWDRRNR